MIEDGNVTCYLCDPRGWVLVLPETAHAFETYVRCPHNSAELLEIKRRAEQDRAEREAWFA